jgi:hypothetical protein
VTPPARQLRTIRFYLFVVILGLIVGGATAIPLETELRLLSRYVEHPSIVKVRDGLIDTYAKYPFIGYGTDWLAFGHFVIAIAFIGPWRDPAKNVWVVEFAMIACVLLIPFAFVMGELRGIPWGWRLIDSSFGVFGFIPLWLCRREIKMFERASNTASNLTEPRGSSSTPPASYIPPH